MKNHNLQSLKVISVGIFSILILLSSLLINADNKKVNHAYYEFKSSEERESYMQMLKEGYWDVAFLPVLMMEAFDKNSKSQIKLNTMEITESHSFAEQFPQIKLLEEKLGFSTSKMNEVIFPDVIKEDLTESYLWVKTPIYNIQVKTDRGTFYVSATEVSGTSFDEGKLLPILNPIPLENGLVGQAKNTNWGESAFNVTGNEVDQLYKSQQHDIYPSLQVAYKEGDIIYAVHGNWELEELSEILAYLPSAK